MDIPLPHLALCSAGLGVFSHLAYFIRGEHHSTVHILFLLAVTYPLISIAALTQYAGLPLLGAVQTSIVAYTAYLGALFTSMITYRVYFHPLRQFPGPRLATVTQFYHLFQVKTRLDNFKYLDRMHVEYGKYVRVGPNLLSVADPDLVEVIHGPQTKFSKSEWYDIEQPLGSIMSMRDKALHERRRRHGWDKAFNVKALRSYDPRVVEYGDQLVDQLKRRSGQPVNATVWVEWFSFDVLGDLAFGRSFEGLKRAETHSFINLIHDNGQVFGYSGTLPWIPYLLMRLIPPSLNPNIKLLQYSIDCMDERRRRKTEKPDIVSHLIEAGPFFGDATRDRELEMGDVKILIIAGSDTTASTLAFALLYIAKLPWVQEGIRRELLENGVRRDNADDEELAIIPRLQSLPYLNGVVNETLRLHPPSPGGLFRKTPDEGVVIGGRRVPGGVTVVSVHHSIQRSPEAFVSPNEFVPERWTTKPEMILNKSAYFPFSLGKFSCIGKNLALNEMRVVIAKLVLEFEIALAPGETGASILENSKDVFTTICGDLMLTFTCRE
ncbi:cytochrome P450 monooxygenase-like protein [Xylariomycetidae sp. FL2044]|nr:cytochrome P450 monooxygenase-like protein [Xylariomycetidae sp. FL2044]